MDKFADEIVNIIIHLRGLLFDYADECPTEEIGNTPMFSQSVLRAEVDGGETDLHFCFISDDENKVHIRYTVDTDPETDEVLSVNLDDCDIIVNDHIYDCINLCNVKKFVQKLLEIGEREA